MTVRAAMLEAVEKIPNALAGSPSERRAMLIGWLQSELSVRECVNRWIEGKDALEQFLLEGKE